MTIKKAPVPVPEWEIADAYALQAVSRGEATPEQQKRAITWIVNNACVTYDFCTTPDIERLCAIFDGRRFAGTQIVKLVNLNISKFKDAQEKLKLTRKEK